MGELGIMYHKGSGLGKWNKVVCPKMPPSKDIEGAAGEVEMQGASVGKWGANLVSPKIKKPTLGLVFRGFIFHGQQST